MKKAITLLAFLLFQLTVFCQFKLDRKDIAPISCTLAAGFLQGTRDQVLYHPNALFQQFPNLNRRFWDIRQGHRWDANHWLKTGVATLFTAAIVFKIGDKKKWYLYIWDGFKYYLPYKLGFFLAYNVTFKNKITL